MNNGMYFYYCWLDWRPVLPGLVNINKYIFRCVGGQTTYLVGAEK